jgi:hypothetical protein
MSVHEYLMNARARRPVAVGRPAAPSTPAPRPRQGVSARKAGQPADGPFPQAQPPGGASLMNDTAAASSHPSKGDPPWPP